MITTIIALAALALSVYLAVQVRKLAKPVESTLEVAIDEADLSTAIKDALDLHLRNYHRGRQP